MSSERSKAVWQQSTPLGIFVIREADPILTMPRRYPMGLGWTMLEVISRFGVAFTLPGNLNERTLRLARRGTLIATGYRVAPSPGSSPIIIAPKAFADGEVSAWRGTLIGRNFCYRDVRLIRRSNLPAALRPKRPRQAPRRDATKAVIRILSKAGLLPELRKQQIAAVRHALEQAGINYVGQDKSLERIIRDVLKPKKA